MSPQRGGQWPDCLTIVLGFLLLVVGGIVMAVMGAAGAL